MDIKLNLEEHENLKNLVLRNKYLLPTENTLEDIKERICRYIKDPYTKDWFRETKNFIPAGSILSGVALFGRSSLSNCYFTPILEDSIEGIFECCKHMARTYSYRGGSGVNISILRPKNHVVSNSAKFSSGAVSFMPLFSDVTGVIGQHGRRGALMMCMDIRHPDAMDFIWAKSKPEQVFGVDHFTGRVPDISHANISLLIPDSFMEACVNNLSWTFKFPDREANEELYEETWNGDFDDWTGEWKEYSIGSARSVLAQIAEAAWTTGDPGVIFLTTMKEFTPGSYIHPSLEPKGTNPCGEQPLANWNNCLLGALVLPNYVNYPFTKDAKFDMETFEKDVYQAVYFLNNLSDTNENMHPLPEQQEADKFGKRIGLEFTGLADTFAMMGLLYGSLGSIQFIEPILKRKALTEIEASLAIAKEKGCCPAFQFKEARENFLDSPYIENLDLDNSLKKEIIEHGLRNTAFNTVGPTGSISILANNCTSGIEPLYAMSYQRSLRGEDKTFDFIHKPVLDFIIHNPVFRESLNDTGLIHDALDELKRKLNYIEAFEIPWEDRIALQSIVQEYTDSGVSSTINLSNDIAPRTIEKIIMEAWQQDLKGITVFRDGCKKGIYSTGKEQEKALSIGPYIKDTYDYEPGGRHRVYWHGSKLYVMVSQDNDGLPLEIFAILPREAGINGAGVYQEALYQEKYSLWSTITRLTSLLCRSDIPLELIIKQLDKSTFSVNDASAVLARILRVYLPIDIDDDGEELGLECPDCGERTVFMQGGCPICRSCGYSRC